MTLTGGEETLATCTKPGGVKSWEAPSASGVRFLFPDDGRTYNWQIFNSNTCSNPKESEVVQGSGTSCVNVPNPKAKFGAVRVFT